MTLHPRIVQGLAALGLALVVSIALALIGVSQPAQTSTAAGPQVTPVPQLIPPWKQLKPGVVEGWYDAGNGIKYPKMQNWTRHPGYECKGGVAVVWEGSGNPTDIPSGYGLECRTGSPGPDEGFHPILKGCAMVFPGPRNCGSPTPATPTTLPPTQTPPPTGTATVTRTSAPPTNSPTHTPTATVVPPTAPPTGTATAQPPTGTATATAQAPTLTVTPTATSGGPVTPGVTPTPPATATATPQAQPSPTVPAVSPTTPAVTVTNTPRTPGQQVLPSPTATLPAPTATAPAPQGPQPTEVMPAPTATVLPLPVTGNLLCNTPAQREYDGDGNGVPDCDEQ